jgi:hypothetical protein
MAAIGNAKTNVMDRYIYLSMTTCRFLTLLFHEK